MLEVITPLINHKRTSTIHPPRANEATQAVIADKGYIQ